MLNVSNLYQSHDSFYDIRWRRHELEYLGHKRPNISAVANMDTQITRSTFGANHIHLFNECIKHVQATSKIGLLQQKLDMSTVLMVCYYDSSFANNPMGQLSYDTVLF